MNSYIVDTEHELHSHTFHSSEGTSEGNHDVSIVKEEAFCADVEIKVEGDLSDSHVKNTTEMNCINAVNTEIVVCEPSWTEGKLHEVFIKQEPIDNAGEIFPDVKQEPIYPEFVSVGSGQAELQEESVTTSVDPLAGVECKLEDNSFCLLEPKVVIKDSAADSVREYSIKCRTFSTSQSFIAHVNQGCTSNRCPTCNKTFTTIQALDLHMKNVCVNTVRHKCKTCEKTFTTKYHLSKHVKYDCGLQEPHTCKACGKKFTILHNLQRHVKHDCGRKEPHKCSVCAKTFTMIHNLISHIKHDCGLPEPHKCKTCDRTFKSLKSLRTHMRYDCNLKEPYLCKTCGKKFKILQYLQRHMREDCNQMPHKCNVCGKTFTMLSVLRSHVKHDCGRQEPHRCTSCGRTYQRMSTLCSHIKHDCGRKEPHKCKMCEKTFSQLNSLRRHMKHFCTKRIPLCLNKDGEKTSPL